MEWVEFKEQMRTTGRYETVDDRRVWAGRFDLYFYLGLMRIVWNCSSAARRGDWSTECWGYWSYEVIKLVERCGGRFEIKIPAKEMNGAFPAVVVANHMSLLETTILPAILLPFGSLAFVIKDNLLRYPVFRHTMRATGPISVSRKDARSDLKTVMREGVAALKAGRQVLIFPQATRDTVFRPAAFNSLGARLAEKAGRPMVPLALKTDFLGLGRVFKDIGRLKRDEVVRIHCGLPRFVTGGSRREHAAVRDEIGAKLAEWGIETEKETEEHE